MRFDTIIAGGTLVTDDRTVFMDSAAILSVLDDMVGPERAVLAREMRMAPRGRLPAIIEAHAELNRLAGQAPTYNFDPGLLVMEIGSLLASAAAPRETA